MRDRQPWQITRRIAFPELLPGAGAADNMLQAAGLPEEGIAPGTRWQDVPDTWTCPDCSVSKADFQMRELQN